VRDRRTGVPAALAAIAIFLTAASAQGATLEPDPRKPCYGTGDSFNLLGSGFTPNRRVKVTRDGRRIDRRRRVVADADGAFDGGVTVPLIEAPSRIARYVARDTAEPPEVARLSLRLSSLRAQVLPAGGRPTAVRRIRARGFTRGTTLYMHVVGERTTRNMRLGRLHGACKTISVRRRLFRRARVGDYTVQLDTFRRYKRARPQRVAFDVTIFEAPLRRRSAPRSPRRGRAGSGSTRAGALDLDVRVARAQVLGESLPHACALGG